MSSPIRLPTPIRRPDARNRLGDDARLPPLPLDLGLGVAEAMDTAQRGMGLDWAAPELDRARARGRRGRARRGHRLRRRHRSSGADRHARSTMSSAPTKADRAVERHGGRVILMASRALAACRPRARTTTSRLRPHFCPGRAAGDFPLAGDMFDPALAGYWGEDDFSAADVTCFDIIGDQPTRSTASRFRSLDEEGNRHAPPAAGSASTHVYRRRFQLSELIAGDERRLFGCPARHLRRDRPAASAALRGSPTATTRNPRQFSAPTVPLRAIIFKAPTRFYKTGVVFLAYLNGHQDHFVMIGGTAVRMRPLVPIWPSRSGLPTKRGLLAIPTSQPAACARCWRSAD